MHSIIFLSIFFFPYLIYRLSLVIWIGVLIWTFFNTAVSGFYGATVVLGLVLGGSQALSRGLFGRIIPRNCQNELYSFYEVSQRGTAWMGPLVYGAVTQTYNNNPRPGILVMVVFFVVGLIFLFFVNVEKGEHMARDVDQQFEVAGVDGTSVGIDNDKIAMRS